MKSKIRTNKIVISCFLIVSIIVGCYFSCLRIPTFSQPVFSSSVNLDISTKTELISQSKNFKVMVISDLHNSVLLSILNNKSFEKLNKVLEIEQPNFVVLNGDSVWSLFNGFVLEQLCQFFEEKHIYFAYNFGNHDTQFGKCETQLISILEKYEYSLFKRGYNLDCYGNYFVVAKQFSTNNAYSFCIMNSKSGVISTKQIDWYESEINNINSQYGYAVNNALFMHHPMKQVEIAQDTNNYSGNFLEDVSPLYNQNNLFEKLISCNATKYVFSSHDHPNDIYFVQDNITFRTCRSSGYSAYRINNHKLGVEMIDIDLESHNLSFRTTFYA